MKTYEQLRKELKSTFIVTKGEFKIPIAVNLENFDIDFEKLIKNLDNIMQQLFAKKEQAKEISKTAFSSGFTDLFTGEFTGIVRFDTMFNQDGEPKLVEVNAKWPDGLLIHDNIYSILLGREKKKNLELFLQLFDKDEYIFIIYEEPCAIDVPFLEYETLKSKGYKVGVGTFDDMVFKDGFAYYKDNKIDVLRLSVSPGKLTENQILNLKSAKLRYINTPDLASMGDKSLMEGIENEMIMKTTILDEKITNEILENKDKYVIKPTNKDEGNGVYIGIEKTQSERDKLVNENIGKQYLAQEYIQVKQKKIKIYLDGDIKESEVYYDCCPHIFYKKGKMIGCGQVLVRYSQNRIVNLTKGGCAGYMKQD